MGIKKKKNFSLNEDTIDKIVELAEDNKVTLSAIVDKAIENYYKDKEKEYNILKETLSYLLDEKLKSINEDLKRIRVTGNVIDRDTKMMLEFWNHYFILNEFNMFVSTEEYKTKELSQAEALIKKRITENRQRRLEWEEKRQQNVINQ